MNRIGRYIWSLQWTGTRWGKWALFMCTFADASILPLPSATFFLILIFLNPSKSLKYIIFGTLGTLTGALAGYSIGHFIWFNPDSGYTGLGQFLLNNIPGFSESVYLKIQILYAKWGFWILLIAASTPIPYGLFSISSGVFDINIFIFVFATLISQGIKFIILAVVTIKLGPEVKNLFKFSWKPIAIITTVCIVIAIVIIKVI